MRKSFISIAALSITLASPACSSAEPSNQGAVVEQKSGLSAVRLIGPKPALEKMADAAAKVRWTERSYDSKGRLVLPVPANYTPEDFGRLLEALDPYTSDLQGLQMLGPNGGPVDDKGIEHPDD